MAVAAAERGAEVQRRWFGSASLEAEEKDLNDFVSRADRESEAVILETIRDAFPEHSVLAEEGGLSGASSGEYRWVVDPLDGTANFLRGVPYFCVSVACMRGTEVIAGVVLDPLRRDLFAAEVGAGARRNGQLLRMNSEQGIDGAFLATGFPFKAHPAIDLYLSIFGDLFRRSRGIRRCGAAALDLAYTAAGVYDGFFEFRLAPWDLAAGTLLIREAGGLTTDLDGGGGFLETGNLLAGGRRLHADLSAVVSARIDEAGLDRLCPR